MKVVRGVSLVSVVMALLTMALAAQAVELRVRCDYRPPQRERTKISVDVKNLTVSGSYVAQVDTITATDTVTLPNDEADFDFDSNPANIAQGAPWEGLGTGSRRRIRIINW